MEVQGGQQCTKGRRPNDGLLHGKLPLLWCYRRLGNLSLITPNDYPFHQVCALVCKVL